MNAKIGHRTVRKGDAGPDVKLLQEKLIEAGHSWHRGHRLKPDGHFGQDTDALLRQFQAARGLIADGIAGPKTWMVLNGRPTQGLPVCTWASWTYNGLSCDPYTSRPRRTASPSSSGRKPYPAKATCSTGRAAEAASP